MKHLIYSLALLGLLIWSQPSNGKNYYWATNWEHSMQFPGDIIRFFGRDSLWGPVRSNDCLVFQNISGWTWCTDTVVTSCSDMFVPPDFCPVIFNAPPLVFPEVLTYHRERAAQFNQFFHEPGHEWRAVIEDSMLLLYHYPEGTLFDTTSAPEYSVNLRQAASPVVFIDGKLDLKGELRPTECDLILGCSEDIRLIDNVMLAGTDPTFGTLPEGATSRMAIASEQSIYIANTWENGRENRAQGADIVITALLFALRGSVQIEQMNDVGDLYVCPTPPGTDERGNMVLTGGITQFWRGYLHRSNHGGTGYNKVFHWDERLRNWNAGVLEPFVPREEDDVQALPKGKIRSETPPAALRVSPNPFNATAAIEFELPESAQVTAVVHDIQGRLVARLADGPFTAGRHQLVVGASTWSSGLYFLRLETQNRLETAKLMLIK